MITRSITQRNNEGDRIMTLTSSIGQNFDPYDYFSV